MSSRDARLLLDEPGAIQESPGAINGVRSEAAAAADGSSLLDRLKLKLSSDEELAAKLQAGQTEALTALFERYSPLVFRNARRVLRNDAEAEDVVQQVFLDLLRSADKFDPEKSAFRTWLLMLAYCRTINRWRHLHSSHYYDSANLEDILPEIVQGAQRPFPFRTVEAICLVEQALRMIQPRQRRTIELIYYEGLTAEEVAERTGESTRVVRHNLYRGLEKLRCLLGEASAGKDAAERRNPEQVER